MVENPKNSNVELEFKRLEKRLEELVTTVHRLKDENRALRQRQESSLLPASARAVAPDAATEASGKGSRSTSLVARKRT